jgi:16S rRNA (cytidine1402-2'-O)-methyltransferase
MLGSGFRFLGFLPRRASELRALWEDVRTAAGPVVAFESPQRLPSTLAALAAVDPEREAAVCRELTKRFEEVVRGTAAELAKRFSSPPQGEITIVLAAATSGDAARREPPSADAAARTVAELVALGVPRGRAAGLVARLTGLPRASLYRRT